MILPNGYRKRMFTWLSCVFAGVLSLVISNAVYADESALIKKFVTTYCMDCHGTTKKKASVSFADADFELAKHASVYFWQDALDVLNSGEMPPEDESQPTPNELKLVIGAITDRLQSARKRLESTGGVIAMRHLNRREYVGSIKDLFGSGIDTVALPYDAKAGFDTNGSDQFFTANHYESYLDTAQKTARRAIQALSEPLVSQTHRYDPEVRLNTLKKGQLADLRKKMTLLNQGATFQEAGFDDATQASLFKRRYKQQLAKLNRYFSRPNIEVGSSYKINHQLSVKPRARYDITIVMQSTKKAYMPVAVNHQQVNAIMVSARPGKDQAFTFSYETDLLTDQLEIALRSPDGGYIDNLQVTGPYPLEPSFFEKTFRPLFNQQDAADEDVAAALLVFAERAFRYQSVDLAYIKKLLAIYQNDRASGLKLTEAIVDPVAAIIAAPDFLYVKERNTGNRAPLSQHEFAIRLAYFLWSMPPDELLYTRVNEQSLFDEKVLVGEVKRMLASRKADIFLESFINQWSEIARFDEIDLPDRYQVNFKDSARRELGEFFKVLARENLSVDQLIDSDFVVIDSALATYYGLPGNFQNGFQKTRVPQGHPRGGMLGQAAFLMMGTSGPRTSPTIRGTLIREIFLHDPPPAPPPNVPQIEADDKHPKTVREQVRKHKQVPQCASCHEKIDPIGFGLENFDYLGRWRTMETLRKVVADNPRRKKAKTPQRPFKKVAVDASGYLSESERFDDYEGFKQALLQRKDRLALSIYEALLSYGIGREIEFVDEDDVDAALLRLKRTNYGIGDMIAAVIMSRTFMTK